MSRCFPFPPPGYEKKPRTDDAHTLLIKETHKEKKHKKEKDKKKEGKEKKDKEGSKDKHREKKEKKEKHKERKKDKEKNKRDEKDKNKTDEKKIDEQPNAHNRGKHGENSHQVANIKDAKFEVELSQGIGDEERGRRNQMVEDFTPSGQREVGGMGRTVEKNGKSIQHDISDAKFAVEFNRRNQMAEDSTARDQRKIYGMGKLAEKRGENTHLDADTKGAKYAVEVSKKVADTDTEVAKYEFSTKVRDGDSKGTKYALEFNSKAGDDNTRRNRPTEHFQSDQIKEVVSMGRMLEKNNDARLEGKGVDKKVHDTKADRQGINDERRGMQVPIFTGVDPRRVEGMVGSMEKNAPRRVEGMVGLMEKDAEKKRKEKSKGKDGDDKQKNQKKDRNGEKKRKDKDKKHKVKDKDKIEQPDVRNMNQDGMKASLEEPTNVLNVKPLQIPINTVKSVGIEDNPKKRKDGMTNGFLHDNDRPTKLLKPTISSHTFNGNGKKLEPCQTTIQGVSGTQHGVMNNLKADVKEHKINGLLEAQHPSISSKPSSLANVQGSENGKAISEPKPIIEPPHPDSKYLNVVLSVPKMDEWSEFDDTEWLFSRNSPLLKKPNLVSSGSNEAPRVWDKAIQIDSADIFALPYVVPY